MDSVFITDIMEAFDPNSTFFSDATKKKIYSLTEWKA